MSGGQHRVLGPGDEVDGFVIEDVLGVGGTSTTYRARQGMLERSVMLKVFHEHSLAADPELRRSAEGEAARAARLEHPGIATVYDMGSIGDAVYVASALTEAESLSTLVAAEGMTPRRCAKIVSAVADALSTAHEHSVVHREVRPEAISVGPWDQPVLRDFGVARISGRTGLATRMEFAETLRYVAPELILGREATPAADVYGLAAVAVFCLAGEQPFPDLPPAEMLSLRAEAPAPGLIPHQPALAACLDAAMDPDPSARPSTPVAFAEKLTEAIGELPEDLRERPSPFSISAATRRRPSPIVGDETRVDRRREPQAVAEQPQDGDRRALWAIGAVGFCVLVVMFALGYATAPGPPAPLQAGGNEAPVQPLWGPTDSPQGPGAQLAGAVGLEGSDGTATVAPIPPSAAGEDPREGLSLTVREQLSGAPQPAVAGGRVLVRYGGGGGVAFLARGPVGGLLISCAQATAAANCAAVAAGAQRDGEHLAPAPPSADTVNAVADAMKRLESRRGIAAGEFQGGKTLWASAATRVAGADREAAEALASEKQGGVEGVVEALEEAADAYEDFGNELDRDAAGLSAAREQAMLADRELARRIGALRYWGFPVSG